MKNQELQDRVALVTGASRGLGRGVAVKLASLGCKVAVNYLKSDDKAEETAAEIRNYGSAGMLLKADVGDETAVKEMIGRVVDKWGKIDILVNNAGIVKDKMLLRMSSRDWDRVMDTNLRGAFHCTKHALLPMMEQLWGRIINVSSLGGFTGNPGQANYSAAKGGLNAFTKSVAREVGSRNITVNAVAPGFITTDMTSRLPQETRDMILARIPLNRFGTPEDVAELVAFLASERASYITAQVICIDGGVI
jgi:3-oxoacyl-[acyl-carrier protein] reductase